MQSRTMSFVVFLRNYFTLVAMLSIVILSETGCKAWPKAIEFHVKFTNAFYPIKKSIVEEAVQNRLNTEQECGPDINFTVPDATHHFSHFNDPNDSVIMVQTVHFESPQLHAELPGDVREQYATSYFSVGIYVPFLKVKSKDVDVTLQLAFLTKGPRKVIYPYFHQDVKYVDDITFTEQQITLSSGDDRMTINFEENKTCTHEFSHTSSKMSSVRDHFWSSFPAPFDVNFCELTYWNPSICEKVRKNSCALHRSRNDYCIKVKVESSIFCDAFMGITEASGIFAQIPLLSELVGPEKKKGIWGHGNRTVNFVFPCLTQ